MSSTKPSPADFLPLHPFELRILLVLCEGKAHGYRIVKVIEERDAGWKRIFPANLYRRLRELLVAGLIVETEGPAEADDPRRRYFRVTSLGREVARLEARRLSELAADARWLLEGG